MSLKQNENVEESKAEMEEENLGYIEDSQLELTDELSLTRYPHQLTSVWLKMVRDYPYLYTMDDYFEACKKSGILIF